MQPNTSNTSSTLRDFPNPFVAHRTPGDPRISLKNPAGDGFGELRIKASGADIVLKDIGAVLERGERFHYRLTAGETELLSAAPRARRFDELSIHSAKVDYEVRVSPLRNTATVISGDGEAASVSGGLLGMKYRLHFQETDSQGPLVALVALFHLLVVRSRAFRVKPAHVAPGSL